MSLRIRARILWPIVCFLPTAATESVLGGPSGPEFALGVGSGIFSSVSKLPALYTISRKRAQPTGTNLASTRCCFVVGEGFFLQSRCAPDMVWVSASGGVYAVCGA